MISCSVAMYVCIVLCMYNLCRDKRNSIRNHNYETVLPNLLTKPQATKQSQAQMYEIPLSQSATLPRNFILQSDITENGRSQTLPHQKSRQTGNKESTVHLLPDPIYMNVKTEAINPLNPLQYKTTHFETSNYGKEELDEEVRSSPTLSESWAI